MARTTQPPLPGRRRTSSPDLDAAVDAAREAEEALLRLQDVHRRQDLVGGVKSP